MLMWQFNSLNGHAEWPCSSHYKPVKASIFILTYDLQTLLKQSASPIQFTQANLLAAKTKRLKNSRIGSKPYYLDYHMNTSSLRSVSCNMCISDGWLIASWLACGAPQLSVNSNNVHAAYATSSQCFKQTDASPLLDLHLCCLYAVNRPTAWTELKMLI